MVLQTSKRLTSSMGPSGSLLRPETLFLRRSRHAQHVRSFRLGFWSSYLDPNFQKELDRRHRILRHKSLEALSRQLSWDRGLRQNYKSNSKYYCFYHALQTKLGKGSNGRWSNVDGVDGVMREPRNDGEGHDRKGVEMNTSPALSDINKEGFIGARSRASPRSMLERERSSSGPVQDNVSQSQEFEIDPITNRKVFKHTMEAPEEASRKPIQVPVKTFKGYRSRFEDFAPPISGATDGKPGSSYEAQPKQHCESMANDPVRENLNLYEQKHKPIHQDRSFKTLVDLPDHLRGQPKHSTAEVGFDSLSKASESGEENIEQRDSVQDGLKTFDAKMSYDMPFLAHEPNGKPPTLDISKLGERKRGESRGLYDPVQEGLKAFDAKMSYGKPFLAYEPDGKPDPGVAPNTARSVPKGYDSEVAYDQPFAAFPNDSDVAEQNADPTREYLKRYEKNRPYKPVYRKDSGGGITEILPRERDSVAEGLKNFDSRHHYGPVYYNEPDGKPRDPLNDGLKGYDSRTNYSWRWSSRAHELGKVLDKQSDGMDENIESLRPSDIRAASGIMKRTPQESDVGETIMHNEQNKPLEPVVQSVRESDVTQASERLPPDRVAQPRSSMNVRTEEGVRDLPRRATKMTGNFVRDFPEDFNTTWTTENTSSGSLVPNEAATAITEASQQDAHHIIQKHERAYIDGLASVESFSRNPEASARLEPSLNRASAVREQEDPGYGTESSHQGEGDLSTLVSSYSPTKRESLPADQDSSLGSQMTEHGKDNDLIDDVRSIYEETYGTIDGNHRQMPQKDNTESFAAVETLDEEVGQGLEDQGPTLYKILAYDPTMQSVSIAETTSIVPDSSTALTPAEVLLRLSNPAKFFPHFKPLQSQGYEIVSGSGDVLVFRKVRSAEEAKLCSEPPLSPEERNRKATNPIDGMQSSPIAATGNFASPTGFVNHDFPPRSEPTFKSNIDVRREEPVFSGKRNWYDENEASQRKKAGKGKRLLVGAVWLGACSYAVGVVAEFFKTGGIDGKGPTGF